jgi:hypothetical protein
VSVERCETDRFVRKTISISSVPFSLFVYSPRKDSLNVGPAEAALMLEVLEKNQNSRFTVG